jgi:hypothetical protein
MTSTGNVQADLEALRSDIRRLSEQVSGMVESRSQPAWRVMSDATAKGQEVMHAVGEVGHTMVDAIDESLRARSLLIARSSSACFLDCPVVGTAADKQKGHGTSGRGSNNKTRLKCSKLWLPLGEYDPVL